MVFQESRVDQVVAGLCSDCGLYVERRAESIDGFTPVSYTHLRAHET